MEPKKEVITPLVSVVVITYNSMKYVLETLESINTQSYSNIELIISDDGSKDETLTICKKWIKDNHSRFSGVHIIEVEKNTGIPSNCNRGWERASGEWIKFIAGDDLLKENCITDNVAFVLSNRSRVVFSKRVSFTGDFKSKKIYAISKPSIFNHKKIDASDQYQLALRGIGCPPNTMFFEKKLLKRSEWF